MPQYEIRDPQTGRVVVIRGDSPPTDAEIGEIVRHVFGRPVSAEDFTPPPSGPPDLNKSLGRFVSNAAEVLNPLAAIQGLYGAARHPIETARNIGAASAEQKRKAQERFAEGRNTEAVGHAIATLPVLGPAIAEAGEQIASGDVAGGLGRGMGLLVPVPAVSMARGAVSAAKRVAPQGVREAAAGILEHGAAERVADVMSPKVGANKTRFGNRAAEVAPELAKDPSVAKWSRQGMHAEVSAKLDEAERGLDAAQDARLSARTFNTEPIIADLLKKRRELTAETVEASGVKFQPITVEGKHATTWTEKTGPKGQSAPVGSDVVPGPNAARVAQIDQAIAELRQLGPVARYEAIRRIRQAYDQPARVKYNPSVTQDYLKAQGGASGAADVTGVLREHLARFDPETAAANAQYSLYRTADDVLKATEEVQRTRPTVGRQIVARLTGSVVGGETAGAAGAVTGYLIGPVVDGLLNAGVTTKLQTAGMMTRLAQAIRSGDLRVVDSIGKQLRRLGVQAATLTATSPSVSQRDTALASQ